MNSSLTKKMQQTEVEVAREINLQAKSTRLAWVKSQWLLVIIRTMLRLLTKAMGRVIVEE